MTKLKFQFALFFLFLAALFGFFTYQSFEQIRAEEKRLWQGTAEKAFNQMQARVSDFLTSEDNRAFEDYDPGPDLKPTPLSLLPRHDPRGLVGYFQINPDGAFVTPYLVKSPSRSFAVQTKLRLNLHRTLQQLTGSFLSGLTNVIDLEALSTLDAKDEKKSDDVFVKRKIVRQELSVPKQIYPNPLMKQQNVPEAPEVQDAPAFADEDKALEELEAEPTTLVTPSVAPNVSSGSAIGPPSETADDESGDALTTSVYPEAKEASLLLDPFRARLVEFKHVIFYRKVWQDQKMYIQGFVVRLDEFYAWLMQQSFDNSDLPAFAMARLELDKAVLATYGNALAATPKPATLFEGALGYPLNQFVWRVSYHNLPELPTRRLITFFTALVLAALCGGLFLLYRTAAAQVSLSQKRQDFVSAVTHELKTPLTSIRMSAEMLKEGWIKDETKRGEYYGVITKESERLSHLINNVLQLARLEKKNARVSLVTQSPNEAFRLIAGELEDFVVKQGFEWQVSEAPDLPAVSFDPDAVKQILFNLVDNAIKFSQYSPEKIIRMELKRDDDRVVWSISDAGPGVPKKEIRKIFDKFYRVENELTRKTKGTGIGLAMVKMMAENMGATIEAKNLSPHGLSVHLIFATKNSRSN